MDFREAARVLDPGQLHLGMGIERLASGGAVLHSHLWIGQDLAGMAPPEAIAEIATEELGFGLLRHAYNEMSFLARFLPSLCVAANRATERPVLPGAA